MRNLLTLAVVFASVLTAADISGKWKGIAEGPNGTIERTFDFKQDGAKLTGNTDSEITGHSTINNGTVEGDRVTFSINAKYQGDELKLTYTGRISGAEMTLDVDFGANDGPKIKYFVKRMK